MAKINFSKKKNIFAKLGRKNLVIICAVLIIGIAVYLNYAFFYDGGVDTENPASGEDSGEPNQNVSVENSYFTATQLSRKQARDEALDVLQSVLDNEEALESTKASALEEMTRIATEIEMESNIEALVTSKGFDECVAVMNGDSVSVIVKSSSELLPNQLTQINEIVHSTTGITPSNVNIIRKA